MYGILGFVMEKMKKYPLYFIFPALLLFIIFFVTPTIENFYYSFTDWNTYASTIHFTGFKNIIELFKENVLPLALKNTLIYAFFVTIFVNIVGLLLALMLNDSFHGVNFFRTVFYIPVVIAPLIVGYIFTAIYNPTNGILNEFLRLTGLGILASNWLSDNHTALYSIIATEIWKSSGFTMIIFLAGLKTVSVDLLDAANVDGANYFQKCVKVMLPMIAPAFTVNILVTMIDSLKVFETVLVLTGGGPGYDTEVINTFIYRNFARGNWGYAAAGGLIQSVIIAAISVFILIFLRKREVDL
jgi:raffinose/stachyose/melibiose transport system permease protein